MATKTSLRKHPKPKIQNFGIDPWTIHVNSKLVELESVKAVFDRKWGENRLITLVSSELREKFWIQNSRIYQSMESKDRVKFDSSIAGMIRAYAVLDQWATDEGIDPASSIPRIEWEMQNGQVMVIVRTVNEAVTIQAERKDVANQHIWSMQEIEVLLAEEEVQKMIRFKALVPTAQMTKFKKTGGETGFDDFENDLTFSENEVMEKKFDAKAAERFKNGQIKRDHG